MGSLGPTYLIALLLAVAAVSAICGFRASAVARRNKRRVRASFLLGCFCGLLAGAFLRRRRRRLSGLRVVARSTKLRPRTGGIRGGTGHFAGRALTFAASQVPLGRWPRNGATKRAASLRPFSVELPGIEPGSYGIPSRLLRAQFALPLLGSLSHANKPR
jgi:hypothetical protein